MLQQETNGPITLNTVQFTFRIRSIYLNEFYLLIGIRLVKSCYHFCTTDMKSNILPNRLYIIIQLMSI